VIDYGMNVQEAVDAPRFHQQWLPDVTNIESFAISPRHAQAAGSLWPQAGAPATGQPPGRGADRRASLGGKPVGKNRFYGANDPRRNSGLALGF
jgi:gamma-glutamyltranspeptidase/glutathione hydrolase